MKCELLVGTLCIAWTGLLYYMFNDGRQCKRKKGTS